MDWKSIGSYFGLKVRANATPTPVTYSKIIVFVSLLDGLLWCSRYSSTISWVTLPVLQTPYPIAQKCLPQYLFDSSLNSIWSFLDVLPLSFFTMSLIERLGGYSICIWMWSLLTTPLSIRISCVTGLNNQVSASFLYVSFEYSVSIFCYPNNMCLHLADCMSCISHKDIVSLTHL